MKLQIDSVVVGICTVLMVLMDLGNVKQAIFVIQELLLLCQMELQVGDDLNYQCPVGQYCLKVPDITAINTPLNCSASKYTYNLASNSIDD